ncbi:hypothetical protein E2C01_003656 [Portunus trituberculatus]|uniref:Uncharacterized protein n=1 Tax=Portunus trituberculatus TaxID=210409 RepID=A0A5B7CNJ9_PORTR|nr:hypothetical protein [Portunus trituberculatus]
MVLKGLTLGRLYGGQKVNGNSLHYLNPSDKFLKLYRITKSLTK